jgi:hypothetical protein
MRCLVAFFVLTSACLAAEGRPKMSSFNDQVKDIGPDTSSFEPDRPKISPPPTERESGVSGRPKMSSPPPDEEIVKVLFDELSSACSKGRFRDYMNCFTPSRASVIRRAAEDFFICGDAQMEVLDHFVISSGDETIEVGVKYMISDSSAHDSRIVCSKVFVKKIDDSWKINSEEIRDVKSRGTSPQKVPNFVAQNQNQGCSNGRCSPSPPPKRTYPNPANGGEEAWLPKDIGYTPGPSCANGQCRIK